MLPEKVNVLGIEYKVEYVEKPSDVDIYKRESLWGQVDFWTRTIRIYKNGRPEVNIWETLFHEIIHAIAEALRIKVNGSLLRTDEDATELLALALTDTLFRNEWMKG